ncbi:alpha/beta hydrolase [Legionella sp. CNM-4043-24]|uniref:alpha/beta hydrolase n=1 Tax=Legionella sp. CNM-4043-24 TaxID=3421646 RepID=UPI00403AEAE2
MPLNESEKKFFERLQQAQQSADGTEGLDIHAVRRFVRLFDPFVASPAPLPFQDKTIMSSEGHPIRIRHYRADNNMKPVIIFFPGNAFIHDLFEVNHSIISKIAFHAQCHAVMVDYRLAPEHQWPAQVQDALEATRFVFDNIEAFQGDRARIILSGFSSGANLAAIVTNTLRSNPHHRVFYQFLISGAYDYTNSLHEYDAFALEDKMLDPTAARLSFDCYVPIEKRKDPLCSPYWEEDLSSLPPTTVMVAEFDGGRSQSEGYAKRLIEAGNQVEKLIMPGQTHGTIMYRNICSDGDDPAIVAGNRIFTICNRRAAL